MIGKLKEGVIASSYATARISSILDVHGVGYHRCIASARTLQALPAAGEAATLSIETHVREDQIRLFGFQVRSRARMVPPAADRAGRRRQGGAVGAVDAQAGRSRDAIAMRDKAAVARTPGVGPKVAERIVTELKDKAPAYADIDPAVVRLSGASWRTGARRGRSPMRSRRWSISAMVSRRRPPRSRRPRARPARARTPRS